MITATSAHIAHPSTLSSSSQKNCIEQRCWSSFLRLPSTRCKIACVWLVLITKHHAIFFYFFYPRTHDAFVCPRFDGTCFPLSFVDSCLPMSSGPPRISDSFRLPIKIAPDLPRFARSEKNGQHGLAAPDTPVLCPQSPTQVLRARTPGTWAGSRSVAASLAQSRSSLQFRACQRSLNEPTKYCQP